MARAFASDLHAVRLGMAIWRHDVRWREGDALGAAWAHSNRGDGRVIRQRVPVRELTRATVGAREGLGGTGGRTIQCHQALLPEDPDTVEHMMLGKALKDGNKDGIDMTWGDRIEEGAQVMITGNFRDATQRLGVSAALVCLAPPWVRSPRGRLGKEDAQGAYSSIGHTVLGMATLTTVGQWRDPLLEHGPEILEA